MSKRAGQSRLVGVFSRLINDVRAAELLESVRSHFADARVGMVKKVGQSRRRKRSYAIPPFVHLRLLPRHSRWHLGIGFQGIVASQFKESICRELAHRLIGIIPQVEQGGRGGFGGSAEVANRTDGIGAHQRSWVVKTICQRRQDEVGQLCAIVSALPENAGRVRRQRRISVLQDLKQSGNGIAKSKRNSEMRDGARAKLLVRTLEPVDERFHREFLLRIMAAQDLRGVKGQFTVCVGKGIRECGHNDLVERPICVKADEGADCGPAKWTRLIGNDVKNGRQSIATDLSQNGHAIIDQRRLGQEIGQGRERGPCIRT